MTTKSGRVVYRRKPNLFTGKSAARIVRTVVHSNFEYLEGIFRTPGYLNGLAWMIAPKFFDWGADYNFFPRATQEIGWEPSKIEKYAHDLAWNIASIMGVPDWVEYLTDMIFSEFSYGQFAPNLTLDPRLASIIVQSMSRPEKTEEEIYGKLFE